jgi:hypothetical protein
MRLLSLLIIFIVSFSSTSLKSKETEQYSYAGIIIMSCNNLNSVQKIAAADRVSIDLARSTLHKEVIKANCGFHTPAVLVGLEKKILEYQDYNGIPTSIWKLVNQKLWSIFSNKKILKNKITPTVLQKKSIGLSI